MYVVYRVAKELSIAHHKVFCTFDAIYQCMCLFTFRYAGSVSSAKAENMIKGLFDGVFLVREDNHNRGEYQLCIRCVYIVCTRI